ncbi:MAG: hypothetical protein HQ592_05500 [Planctomycetes bacterium]|nr:hypothetical protein [Planctomycetota bacterium]
MRTKWMLVGFALVVLLSGCAQPSWMAPIEAIMMETHPKTITTVNLEQKNYRMVKPNAIGKSAGFNLLGIIPLSSPQHIKAMSDLYSNVDMSMGGAYALTHVMQERSVSLLPFFWTRPTFTVRADVIEFTE